jgi:hypothetical protein
LQSFLHWKIILIAAMTQQFGGKQKVVPKILLISPVAFVGKMFHVHFDDWRNSRQFSPQTQSNARLNAVKLRRFSFGQCKDFLHTKVYFLLHS